MALWSSVAFGVMLDIREPGEKESFGTEPGSQGRWGNELMTMTTARKCS